MAATGQGGEGQATQGEGAAENGDGQGQDYGQLTDHFDQRFDQFGQQFGGGLEEMRQSILAIQQQQQQPAEQDQGNDWFGEGEQYVDPTDPAQLANAMRAYTQQATAPLQQKIQQLEQQTAEDRRQQAEDKRVREADELGNEFPELKTPQMANLIAGEGGVAAQMAQELGRPDLAADPKFWKYAFMVHKALEHGNFEGSGDPDAAHVEGGGGPGPQQQSAADLVKQITESGDGLGARVLDGI